MQCLEGIVGNFDRDGGHRHSWFNRIRSACGSRSHVAGLPSQHCNHTWLPPPQSTCATCQTGSATHGLFAERIFIAGGRGRPSVQPDADVLKQPVHLTRESESCALGSAMTAAVAAGAYRDFDDAAQAMVAIEKTVEPNLANAGVYDELFGHYVELYRRLNAG